MRELTAAAKLWLVSQARAFVESTPLPSAEVVFAIDRATRALLDSGLWAEIDALWCFGLPRELALLNWKNPSLHRAVSVNAPEHAHGEGFEVTALQRIRVPETDPAESSRHLFWCGAGQSLNITSHPGAHARVFTNGVETPRRWRRTLGRGKMPTRGSVFAVSRGTALVAPQAAVLHGIMQRMQRDLQVASQLGDSDA